MRRPSIQKQVHTPSQVGKIFFSERKTTIEGKDGEIYYVFETRARGYLHGDTVAFVVTRPARDGKLREAAPTRLVERTQEPLLMELARGKEGRLRPRLISGLGEFHIREGMIHLQGKIGDIFIVRFTKDGRLEKVGKFGSRSDPETQENIILFRHGIRMTWPETVKREETKNIEIPDFQEIKQGLGEGHKIGSLFPKVKIGAYERLDFRGWSTITIDGADARDLDDAISIARYEGGDYLLGVHIADVSEYVREGTSLDHEAYLRGTSVYTPGRVIPMLPEYLSNDLCSLHPGSPKAVLSILIRVDQGGNVKETLITEGVINSIHRGVYEEIGEELKMMNGELRTQERNAEKQTNGETENISLSVQLIGDEHKEQGTQGGSGKNTPNSVSLHRGFGGGNDVNIKHREGTSESSVATTETFGTFSHKSTEEKESNIKESLKDFYSLYKILEKKRKKEGKILFEMTECYFDVDEKRNITNIRKRERGDAHMLIEEFMILANEEVAKWCAKEHLPFLSRVHTAPESEDMRKISEILKDTSLAHRIEPHHIREHLERATNPHERYRLSRLILPKMSKAHYGDSPRGHFGLALAYYSHFTSPIRRYPDLLVHRIIKMHLANTLHGDKKSEYTRRMKQIGKSLSEKEKRAETAERAIDSLMMCRYMCDKVGREYRGTISGLTESNIYVELENGVEGSIFLGGSRGSPLPKGAGGIFLSAQKLTLDERDGSMRNSGGKTLYRIGDPIDIKILSVDMKERRIELERI